MGVAEPVCAAVRRVRGRASRARRAVQQSAWARPRHSRLDRHARRSALHSTSCSQSHPPDPTRCSYCTTRTNSSCILILLIYCKFCTLIAAARETRQREGQRVLGGPPARQRQAASKRLSVRYHHLPFHFPPSMNVESGRGL